MYKTNGNYWRGKQSCFDENKAKFTNIEWAQLIGMRNIFVHEYFEVDPNLVWEIIKGDLPGLKEKIIEILNSIE